MWIWSDIVSKPFTGRLSFLLSASSFMSIPLLGSYPAFSIGSTDNVIDTSHGRIRSNIACLLACPTLFAAASSNAASSFVIFVESGCA